MVASPFTELILLQTEKASLENWIKLKPFLLLKGLLHSSSFKVSYAFKDEKRFFCVSLQVWTVKKFNFGSLTASTLFMNPLRISQEFWRVIPYRLMKTKWTEIEGSMAKTYLSECDFSQFSERLTMRRLVMILIGFCPFQNGSMQLVLIWMRETLNHVFLV